MRKAIGFFVFAVLVLISVAFVLLGSGESVVVEREDGYIVGLVSQEGYRVVSKNPVKVLRGGCASFSLAIEDGYTITDTRGGELDGECVRYDNITSDRSITLVAVKNEELPKITCSSVGEGRAELSPESKKELYLPGESVTIKFVHDENHVLSSLKINGKDSPLPDGDALTIALREDTEIEAAFVGREVFFSLLVSGAGGNIVNESQKTLYRYGDEIKLRAEYDKDHTDFLGYSENTPASQGASLLCADDEYTFTITADTIMYAEFASKTAFPLSFDTNGGAFAKPIETRTVGALEVVSVPIDDGNLTRAGYKLIGYSTSPDGSGTFVSCGAMFTMPKNETILFAVWREYTSEDYFTYKVIGKYGMTITGFSSLGLSNRPGTIVIPETHNGMTVTNIDSASFFKCDFIKEVILPDGVKTMGPLAFASCPNLTTVTFGENLTAMGENAFDDCPNFCNMRVHATLTTVFDIDYDSALVDKYMRLKNTKGNKRIILVGGSNLSMGIDSEMIMDAYKGYEVLNFSTSAHYGLRPLLQLLAPHITENDVIVFALEYTATMYAREETTTYTNWQYIESNYDILSDININELPGLLREYVDYLTSKRNFIASGKKKYNSVIYSRASFNIYGDNTAQRDSGKDISAALPDKAIITQDGIGKINDFCAYAAGVGAKCFFSYPTLCRAGHSDEAIEKAFSGFEEKLNSYLDLSLCPIITDPVGIMYGTEYYYDTQYHLSSEGVAMRTSALISDLSHVLEN